jgi:hypothetical protein
MKKQKLELTRYGQSIKEMKAAAELDKSNYPARFY